jgi:hypothetical protein
MHTLMRLPLGSSSTLLATDRNNNCISGAQLRWDKGVLSGMRRRSLSGCIRIQVWLRLQIARNPKTHAAGETVTTTQRHRNVSGCNFLVGFMRVSSQRSAKKDPTRHLQKEERVEEESSNDEDGNWNGTEEEEGEDKVEDGKDLRCEFQRGGKCGPSIFRIPYSGIHKMTVEGHCGYLAVACALRDRSEYRLHSDVVRPS